MDKKIPLFIPEICLSEKYSTEIQQHTGEQKQKEEQSVMWEASLKSSPNSSIFYLILFQVSCLKNSLPGGKFTAIKWAELETAS